MKTDYHHRVTPERITALKDGEVFVFGSNLNGWHGGGAARAARLHFGAEWGKGEGPQGRSYAIPTMQGGVETIAPLRGEIHTLRPATSRADLPGHPDRLRHRGLLAQGDSPLVP